MTSSAYQIRLKLKIKNLLIFKSSNVETTPA
jgi:hypothetical protein